MNGLWRLGRLHSSEKEQAHDANSNALRCRVINEANRASISDFQLGGELAEVNQLNKEDDIRIVQLAVIVFLVFLLKPPYPHSEAQSLTDTNINNSVQTTQEIPAEQEKQETQPVVQQAKHVAQPAPEPEPVPSQPATSSCASEIQKYNWDQTVAYGVMMAESGGNHLIVNNNPNTGDYSVGCFQVNLYGNLRNTRPSEDWLKVPANNVAYAYQLYQANGWKPWGATTCKYKVSCY